MKSISDIKGFCYFFSSLLILFGKDKSARDTFIDYFFIIFFRDFIKILCRICWKKNVFQWIDQFNIFFQLFLKSILWRSKFDGFDHSLYVFFDSFISWICGGLFLVYKLKVFMCWYWALLLTFVFEFAGFLSKNIVFYPIRLSTFSTLSMSLYKWDDFESVGMFFIEYPKSIDSMLIITM